MSEQELKLHVPARAVEGIKQDIAERQATRLPLRAMYFDTPERELVRARIALRLRQEGDTWVQTVKMPGANAISRIELNHLRPGPVLDLSVYAGTEVGDALARIHGQLGVCYETDVQRLLCKLHAREARSKPPWIWVCCAQAAWSCLFAKSSSSCFRAARRRFLLWRGTGSNATA